MIALALLVAACVVFVLVALGILDATLKVFAVGFAFWLLGELAARAASYWPPRGPT